VNFNSIFLILRYKLIPLPYLESGINLIRVTQIK
jgi:hypothetical protein